MLYRSFKKNSGKRVIIIVEEAPIKHDNSNICFILFLHKSYFFYLYNLDTSGINDVDIF